MPYIAKPTQRQLDWYEKELGVLIHYCMEIYEPTFRAYKTDAVRTVLAPEKITPTKLDPAQWVRAAASMGAKYAVLVANHCTGFSLWPTKVNDYCTRSLSWKNGQGDIVGEFIEACKHYDMVPGLYYSTGCNGYYNINDDLPHDYHADYYREYVRCVEEQVKELWTWYGPLFEIWFDGGIIPVAKGGPNLVPLLEKYQPDALCFQGPKNHPHNLRWVGTEAGLAPEDCWSTTNAGESRYDGTVSAEKNGIGEPDGKYFIPAETDTPNRSQRAFGGGWAWAAGQEHLVRTPEELLDCYIHSVGRNSNLLLGMSISTDGDFQDEAQLAAFGKLLRERFGTPIVTVGNCGQTVTLTVPADKTGRYLVLRENITEGQHVRGYRVLVNGTEVHVGQCIGHKRILPLDLAGGDTVTLELTQVLDGWAMRDVAIY